MRLLHWEQFKCMYKKDWTIRRRLYTLTFWELIFPIVMVLVQLYLFPDLDQSPEPFGESSVIIASNDRYYFHTFYCYIVGKTIFYALPDGSTPDFIGLSKEKCGAETVRLAEDKEVIKAWGDRIESEHLSVDNGLFFHELDPVLGRANYSLGGNSFYYPGPWTDRRYIPFLEYIDAQSVINELLAFYPNYAKSRESDFYYDFTDKLFQEGNPKSGHIRMNTKSDEKTEPISLVKATDFYLSYIFIEIGFIYLSIVMTKTLLREKVTKSKDLLRVIGLSDIVYWVSHFVDYFTLSVFHGSVITFIYSVSSETPFPGWNAGIFWFNYLTDSVTNILFTFTFTTILSRPVAGVFIVLVGQVVSSNIPFAAKTSSVLPKVLSCLLPCGQLHFSLYDMFYFGQVEGQLSFSHLFKYTGVADTVSFSTIYLVTIFSWILYIGLIYYLDSVWPWQIGSPKPWHFPISEFLSRKGENRSINRSALGMSELQSSANRNQDIGNNNEPVMGNLRPSIRCNDLYKSFGPTGSKEFAVNGLNVNILKGQITVLLGLNGAGKTTTMSMITGILKPSSGSIYVNDIDVHTNTLAARQSLALCPQNDLLFEDLTVRENLELCSGLRGLSDQTKKELILLNMERVDLTESENTLVSALSGGMKRRLQLALALSMKSEILILDEPTSGIDPESRRQIWNLLLKLRKDYTILLTTHHMEEADALGDRIIIMSSGKIKCSGSSMFLKKQFGAGYSIRIAKDAWVYKPSELGALITKYFEEATVTNETNLEIIYHLNDKSNQESMTSLANLCDDLDNNPTSFGITSYGVSVTTLEDVFIKVAEDEADKTIITMEDKLFGVDKILDYQRLTGSSLLIQRIKALLMKRFHYTRRHFKTIGFTLIIPALVMMFIFYTSQNAIKYVESITDYPYPIELNAKQIYGSNVKSVIRASFTSKKNQPFIDSYRKSMKSLGIQVVDINSSLTIVDYLSATSQNADQFMKDHVFGIIENDPLDPAPWSELGFSLWYNPKASLSLPLTVDAYTNALLRLKRPELKSPMLYTTYMPMPNRQTLQPKYKSIIARILSAMLSPVAFCLIAVSFFLFPSTESQNKVNLIQKMSGIKAPIFWFSHYIFDLSYNMMIFLIVFLSIIIIDQFLLISFKTFASFMVLFMLFGLASIPLSYLFSFLPLNRDTGFSSLAGISVVSTLIGSALAACLVGFGALKPIHFFIGNLFPPFAMSFGLSKIYGAIVLSTECKKINACPDGNIWARDICCENNSTYITYEPFSWENDGIYPEILILLLDIFLYTIVLIVLDMNLHRLGYWYESNHQSLSYPNSENDVEDKDVVQERDRVKSLISSSGIRNEALIVDDLTKDFESSRAVDRITFGVHKAECFGLLGVNGAGKTTTFRMLTGDIIVTSGEAYIGGYSLRKDLLNFQKSISYCPQSDALLDHLTPVESLMLFARIRGMPESKVKDNVNYLIESTDLTPFANTCNKNLSGGNKRKLSLAIASIAKPEVIFLDEPTTGVDPASRRKIWSTLIHLRDTIGSSIVLTSHSMDECEALCSRIGIMARGNFKCLGSSQHLKEKFGFGFTLIIKMSQSNQSNQPNQWNQQEIQLDKIKIWMAQKFPSSILRDVNKTILHYHLRDTSLRWGQMLRCLDEAKRLLPIEDFTLTGTTLEQIFLSFSK